MAGRSTLQPSVFSPHAVGIDLRIMAPPSQYGKLESKRIKYLTETEVVEFAGDTIVADVDPSWFMCSFVSLDIPSMNYSNSNNPDDKMTKPDGDCSPFLSDECIKAIEEKTSTSYILGYPNILENPYGTRVMSRI